MSDLYDENVPEGQREDSSSGDGLTENRTIENRSTENSASESATGSEHITYSWVSPKIKNEQAEEERPSSEQWRYVPPIKEGPVNHGPSFSEPTGKEPGRDMGKAPRRVKNAPSGKKRKSTGRKWATTVAMAVVFGLVAGLVFTGVTMAGRKLTGQSEQQKLEIASTDQKNAEHDISEEAFQVPEVPAGGTVADVAAQCMPSLVTISTISVEEMQSFFGMTQQYEVAGAGTGVIVGQNDTEILIATNNHVVEGAKSLSVGFIDETAVEGAVKGYDSSTDLAVVAVRLEDIAEDTMNQIKICEMGNSDELVLGEQVVAIGNALGYGQSVTSGYVSAFDRELNLTDNSGRAFSSTGLIQTDASINSGNSGGALLNMRGQLIGINEAKRSGNSTGASVDNIGFAIPISKAEPILENLMTLVTRDKVEKEQAAYIGITCANVSQETAEMYNMPTGVCLTSIFEGSPAEAAGLKKGDILTSFDGREVNSYEELINILQYYPAGETVEVIVQRSDEGEYSERTVTITLGSAADMPNNENN